ncbi:MAG TPA: thiamine pyrophosphate-dependent enzyme [Xanthobacteraceae bacterium]|jgi:benzoylformate decarboxylase|nr:thiamine pyrophosphate-dependent enzyme [Xanthobacteraceae bacterium]
MSGKRAFLELLKQEGVEIVFGNPGTTELPLMDAFAVENEIKYILGLQEAAVMSMADGYAQASGKLAVLNFHVAPGLGNAMGMLYDAQKAAAPILVTAGQQDTDYLATEPILSADLPTLARPFVKWAAEAHRLADLPRLVHRAAKTALAPPTGPVFLGLPGDILKAEGDIDLMRPTRIGARLRGDLAEIAKAATLLAESKRPVIMAGDAVAQSRAFAELVELAELIGAPVYAEFVPNTASFPASHPLFRGHVIRLQQVVRKMLDEYDVLLSVGADLFTLSLPSDVDPMPPGMPLVHLDTDPWEIGKNYPAKAAILGDPKSTLPEITAMVRERMTSTARAEARARLQSASEASLADREALRAKARALAKMTPIQPLALLGAIGDMLPRDAVVIEEALSSSPGIRQLIRSDDPQSYFGLRGGGIGWGLPAAIGVKLALPHRPVVALIGDGSAMYTIQALWTAAHYRIPVAFVILNNSSYRILKQRLHALRGHAEQADAYVGMELLDPAIDFVGLSRSLGVEAERAKTVHEATDLIGKALNDGAPMLIDVELDRAFKPM